VPFNFNLRHYVAVNKMPIDFLNGEKLGGSVNFWTNMRDMYFIATVNLPGIGNFIPGFDLPIPDKGKVMYNFLGGTTTIALEMSFKDRYFGMVEVSLDGDITVSLVGKDISPFQLAMDFIPGFKLIWAILEMDMGEDLAFIKQAAGAMKKVFMEYIKCDLIQGKIAFVDGRLMLMASTSGCSIMKMIEMNVGILMMDPFSDLKLFLYASIGITDCFPACLMEDLLVDLIPKEDEMLAKYLGLFLDVALSPFKSIKSLALQFSTHELRLGHVDFGEGWQVDMSYIPSFISAKLSINLVAILESVYKLTMAALEDAFQLSSWGGGIADFFKEHASVILAGRGLHRPLSCFMSLTKLFDALLPM
jgi:hypothetical protein